MRWKVHGRRTMYESDWVNVYLDDVELPDGTHIDHHILTMPKASQTAIVLDDSHEQILLIWRHRFIIDRSGWEVPAGWLEPGESPETGIRREILEETGFAVSNIERLIEYFAIPGLSTMRFTVWIATAGEITRNPDSDETERVSWWPIRELRELLRSGEVLDGPSLTAILAYVATLPDEHL